jgi:hypothetical protein
MCEEDPRKERNGFPRGFFIPKKLENFRLRIDSARGFH